MNVYCILDATHYPVAIYRDSDKAHKDLAQRNRDVASLCYLIRSKVIDLAPAGDGLWREVQP